MKKIFDKEKLFFFIRKPRFALVISVCIVILGIISILSLKQESYPDVTPPQVSVSASYQGASAEVIESSVATVLENKLNGVENLSYMTSTSYDGSYSLTLYFKVGSDKNINLMNVQNRIQQVQSQLPEDVQRTGVTAVSKTAGAGAVILTLYPESGNWSQLDLTNYGSIYIKDELKRVDGVADVNVFGAGNYSMRIWLDPQKMAGLNVSVSEVKTAIANQNTQVTAGALGQLPTEEKNALQITLKTKGRLDDVKEFENIIIRSNTDGSNVRIKDIARVELGAESYSNLGLVNGKPSAVVVISQLPDANIINLSKAVKAKVEELNAKMTNGIKIMYVKDDAEYIQESMKEVEFTILLTGLIVVIIIYLFLGDAMATLVPCVTIPVSLIGTFFVLKAMGMSINLLTLFAMVLAVGVVVDDAIVVIENVKRHRHKASRNQRYRKALERLGYGELVQLFAQSREQNYCKRKAHPRKQAVESCGEQGVSSHYVKLGNAEDCAVGCNKRQINAHRPVKRGSEFFKHHFQDLHQTCNDENKNYGFQILQPERHKNILIEREGNERGDRHDEYDRHAHAERGLHLFGNAEKRTNTEKLHQYKIVYENSTDYQRADCHIMPPERSFRLRFRSHARRACASPCCLRRCKSR